MACAIASVCPTAATDALSSLPPLSHSPVPLQPHRSCSLVAGRLIRLRLRIPPFHSQYSFTNRRFSSTVAAFSHDESKPSDVEVEKEKSELKEGATTEAEEAWHQALAAFKEQALKLQSTSQEAYEVYSKKAMVVLKETSEKLKIQSEKARQELSVVAKEISEEGKEYLSNAAENSPEPLRDIVETFASSPDELNEASKLRDFYLGIPYGAFLCTGGFVSFMFTGSISAIRFGVILGGTLLALSISSLRSWKNGESSSLALKGQAAISAVLFLREVRLVLAIPSVSKYVTAFVSGSMVAFYIYRILTDRVQAQGSDLGKAAEN